MGPGTGAHHPPASNATGRFPLPLLASTQFCMDILLQGPVLDLGSLREVLTFDPCALLRIYQHTAELFPDQADAFTPLDECIVALGADGLRHALLACASSWQQQALLQTFAGHATAIARASQVLAGTLSLCEETAFLVGAFHELGSLPALLHPELAQEAPHAGLAWAELLCQAHHLPQSLQMAVLAVHGSEPCFPWTLLLEAAHELTESDNTSATPVMVL